jgi:hypothetical protein
MKTLIAYFLAASTLCSFGAEQFIKIVATTSARKAILEYHGFVEAQLYDKAWLPLYEDAPDGEVTHARISVGPFQDRIHYQINFVPGTLATKALTEGVQMQWLTHGWSGNLSSLGFFAFESGPSVPQFAITDADVYAPDAPTTNLATADIGVVHYRILANHGSDIPRLTQNHIRTIYTYGYQPATGYSGLPKGGLPKSMVKNTTAISEGSIPIVVTGDSYFGSSRRLLFALELRLQPAPFPGSSNGNFPDYTQYEPVITNSTSISQLIPFPATNEGEGGNVSIGKGGFSDPVFLAQALRFSSSSTSIPLFSYTGPAYVVAAIPSEVIETATSVNGLGAGPASVVAYESDGPLITPSDLAQKVRMGEFTFWNYLKIFAYSDTSAYFSQVATNFPNVSVDGVRLVDMQVERYAGLPVFPIE